VYNVKLLGACEGGHVSVVRELMKAEANLHGILGNTPLIAPVRAISLSALKCLVEHGADFVSPVVDNNVSAVYAAYGTYCICCSSSNKLSPGIFIGNVHPFKYLKEIKHAEVTTDSGDDVVMTGRSVGCVSLVEHNN
jgi:hypothetical protein